MRPALFAAELSPKTCPFGSVSRAAAANDVSRSAVEIAEPKEKITCRAKSDSIPQFFVAAFGCAYPFRRHADGPTVDVCKRE